MLFLQGYNKFKRIHNTYVQQNRYNGGKAVSPKVQSVHAHELRATDVGKLSNVGSVLGTNKYSLAMGNITSPVIGQQIHS